MKNHKSPRDLGDVKKANWGIFPVNLEENPKDSKNILFRKLDEGFGLRGLKEEWLLPREEIVDVAGPSNIGPSRGTPHRLLRRPDLVGRRHGLGWWFRGMVDGRRGGRLLGRDGRLGLRFGVHLGSLLWIEEEEEEGNGCWRAGINACVYIEGVPYKVPGKWMLAGTPSAPPRGTR